MLLSRVLPGGFYISYLCWLGLGIYSLAWHEMSKRLSSRKCVITCSVLLQVLENEVAFIGNDMLSYPDPEGSPADIVYRVTEPLGLDEGAIEHVDSPFVMLYRFTQEDIDKENIIYRPPITELGSDSREVQFKFVGKFHYPFSITTCPW